MDLFQARQPHVTGPFLALNKVSPNHTLTPPSFHVGMACGRVLQLPSLAQDGGQSQIEHAVGSTYSKELFPVPTEKHPKGRHAIQRHPAKHESGPKAIPILQRDDKVVSEIQVRLERARALQGSASQMTNGHCAHAPNAVPLVFEPPAQIDFFHVGKQGAIETTRFAPSRFSDEKARS